MSLDVNIFLKIVHGAWRNVDGTIRNVSGTWRSVSGSFKSTLVELLGGLTFIIKHRHLVIHKFLWCWKLIFWKFFWGAKQRVLF